MLAEALESTGIAGCPKEYFDKAHTTYWIDLLKAASEAELLDKILKAGTTANGVFAAKLHWMQTENAAKMLGIPTAFDDSSGDILSSLFPKLQYIQLVRADKTRQAISLYRANQTRIWWNIEGTETPDVFPAFNFFAIDQCLRELTLNELRWQCYFVRRGITPLTIIYEEFVEDLNGTVHTILKYLGISIPPGLNVPKPRLKKQADTLSDEWKAKYLRIKKTLK